MSDPLNIIEIIASNTKSIKKSFDVGFLVLKICVSLSIQSLQNQSNLLRAFSEKKRAGEKKNKTLNY